MISLLLNVVIFISVEEEFADGRGDSMVLPLPDDHDDDVDEHPALASKLIIYTLSKCKMNLKVLPIYIHI